MRTKALVDTVALLIVFGLVLYALHLIFMIAPNERIMGPVQRLFYFHVGSAFASYCSIAALMIAAIGYLATRERKYDFVMEAAGEVAFVFCSIVLLSGMIWAKSAWNAWFRWEPRLVSFVLLWLILCALNLLRFFGDKERLAQHVAVFGILAAISVPLVIYSVKLLPQVAQLHPQVLENRGLKHPLFRHTLYVATVALIAFQLYLIWLRTRIAALKHKLAVN